MISIEIYWYLLISFDIYWYLLISIDIYWYLLISIDIYLLKSIDIYLYLLISIEIYWYLFVSIDIYWNLLISSDIYWYLLISIEVFWYLLISYIILWLLDLDWVHLIVDEAFCFQCAAAFVLGKLAPQDSAEPRVQAESSEKSSDKADRCMLKNPSATRSPTRSPSTISIYFTMPPLRSLRAHMLKPRDSRVRENGFMTGCGMMHFHISLFNVT